MHPSHVNRIDMICLQVFGYHDIHKPGDIIPVALKDVTTFITQGLAEIVVNPQGFNSTEPTVFSDEISFPEIPIEASGEIF